MSVSDQPDHPPVADLIGVVACMALLLVVVYTPAGDWRPLALV